jgi:hypothetical protein
VRRLLLLISSYLIALLTVASADTTTSASPSANGSPSASPLSTSGGFAARTLIILPALLLVGGDLCQNHTSHLRFSG